MATQEEVVAQIADRLVSHLNFQHSSFNNKSAEELTEIRKEEGFPEDKWKPITIEGIAPNLWVREERLYHDGTITSHEGYVIGVQDGHWVTERNVRITPEAQVIDKNYNTRLYANEGKATPLPTIPGSMIFEVFAEPEDGQGTGHYHVMLCDEDRNWSGVEKKSQRLFTDIAPDAIVYWSDRRID